MCWGCVFGPLAGAFLGNTCFKSFAWHPQWSTTTKVASTAASMFLTMATALLIKNIFHFPLCGVNGFQIKRFVVILAASASIGLAYAFAINYLFHRFFPVPASPASGPV